MKMLFILDRRSDFNRSKYFHSGIERSGEIPWRWWQVVMVGDENGDYSVFVNTYLQIECQSKSRQNRTLGFFSNQLLGGGGGGVTERGVRGGGFSGPNAR